MLLSLILLTFDVSKLPTIDTSNYSYNMSRFAAAGQVVSNEALLAFNAVHANSPDYAALQLSGMENEKAKRIAANKAEGELYKQAIKSVGTLKTNAIEIDSALSSLEKDIKQRMAGKLAVMGNLVAKAAIKPKEVERPGIITTDRSSQISKAQADLDEATAKYKELLKRSHKEAEIATSSTPGAQSLTNGLNSGSNIFITSDTGRGTGPHLDARVWSHSAGGWVKPTGLYEQYITGPEGQSLSSYGMSSPYGPRTAPIAGASTFHPGEDWLIPAGTRLNVNLPQVEGYHGRKFDPGGGWMSGYRLNDDLELHLLHGQRLASDN